MMNRKEERIKANHRIVLKDGDMNFPAYITTISRAGMSVRTEHIFPTYKSIDILVRIEQQVFSLKASVRWVNEAPGDTDDSLNEIGLALLNPPEEYCIHFD